MSTIWKQAVSAETLNALHHDTAPKHLGIEFLEVGDDYITARMPVDGRTRQPFGILHGGVSVVLAETLGSCGAAFAAPYIASTRQLAAKSAARRPTSSADIPGAYSAEPRPKPLAPATR